MHLTTVEHSNTKRVSLFWYTLYNAIVNALSQWITVYLYAATILSKPFGIIAYLS